MTRPNCKCHGEPMYRHNNLGGWTCSVKKKERGRRYHKHGPREMIRDHTVPCAVLVPLIEGFQRENAHPGGNWTTNNNNESAWMQLLASRSGVSARQIRRIMVGKIESTLGSRENRVKVLRDHVGFKTADRIVCATVGPLAWHQEPLNEFYGPLPVLSWERDYEMPVEEDAA